MRDAPGELPPSVRLLTSPEGMAYLQIRSACAEAQIFFQGAHLASFRPSHAAEFVLFTSAESLFRKGTPIRGGVPVIFPWFGPHPDRADLPAHGLVRTRDWALEEVAEDDSGVVRTTWSISDDSETREAWPHSFHLSLHIEVGQVLRMTLTARNTSAESFSFEEALHSYFTVAEVRKIEVRGLHSTEYLDKVAAMERKTEQSERIKIEGETDRIYLSTETTCYIDDPGLDRTIEVAKSGSQTTVLWNPWINKAASLPDFGDHEWQKMVCIETTNAADNATTLAPGATHQMSVTIRTHPLHGA